MNNNLYSQFTSNLNKGMVWKILCDNRTFEGIPNAKSNLIKEIFDKKISLLAEQINESSDRLVDLNKRVIREMMVTGNNYKQQQEQSPSDSLSSVPELYNASALSEQRQRKFQDELNKKQNDFDSLTQVKIPETPNFSDDLDKPIGSEMDSILAKQIAMREEQLNSVLNRQNTDEAKKWLELPNDITTQETTMNNNNSNNSNNSIVKLKIGDRINVDLNNNNNSQKKQVTFTDTLNEKQNTQPSVDADNFMALLKKKTPLPTGAGAGTGTGTSTGAGTGNTSNNDIIPMLREILNKQNQLLTLLQK
jgi:hypothetical protein